MLDVFSAVADESVDWSVESLVLLDESLDVSAVLESVVDPESVPLIVEPVD